MGQAAERDGDVLHHLVLQANALPGEESSLKLTPGGGVGPERQDLDGQLAGLSGEEHPTASEPLSNLRHSLTCSSNGWVQGPS